MKVIALQHSEVFLIGSLMVRYLREMPLKLSKLQRSIWLYSEFFGSLWLGLQYVINYTCKRVFVDKNCIYYTIFIAHTNPENWRVASLIVEQDLSKVIVLSPVWRLRDTRELMYISHPFYSCFNSLSGPFRNYACRSCLLKLVLINCILWEVQTAHWKCIIRFLPFWLLWNPSDICSYAMKRELIFLQASICFSCIKHQISWRNGNSECLLLM